MSGGGIRQIAWPLSKLGDALEALASRSGLSPKAIETPRAPVTLASADAAGPWIEAAARWMGFEAEPVEPRFADAADQPGAAPALYQITIDETAWFVAVLECKAQSLRVLRPDLSLARVPLAALRAAICEPLQRPHMEKVDRLLDRAGISGQRRARARDAILREQTGPLRIARCWILRLAPHASYWQSVKQAGIVPRFAALIAAHTIQYVLWILSWWMVGTAGLDGRLDRAWLAAWVLLLLTLVPFRLLTTWLQGLAAIGLGGLLKQRLLYGALRLRHDDIRHQGAGQLLGRALESDAVESLALSGGVLGLVAGIELMVAGVVLSLGAAAPFEVMLLVIWTGVALALAWTYLRRYRGWTGSRIDMTNDLVEKMVGHRTRLAQQPREEWRHGEDRALTRYLACSRAMDGSGAFLTAFLPRGWLVVSIAAIAPLFLSAKASSSSDMAVALGGILLAFRAWQKLSASLWQIVGAGVAWAQVAPLFRAAGNAEPVGCPALDLTTAPRIDISGPRASASGMLDTTLASAPAVGNPRTSETSGHTVVETCDLVFRYRERGEPVLRHINLKIREGDKLLLEGPSGGGKSTLGSVLTGLRTAESGLLLAGGLDRQTLGAEGWRKRVGAAPQFHENYVLTGTFAFNLLMGRRWPPHPGDLEDAAAICRQLGLDELLARMPAGLFQMVGESGWQLSHGERSRLYIARALLQDSEMVVLDESFAALDPENLRRSLDCVLERARTLLVIAHP